MVRIHSNHVAMLVVHGARKQKISVFLIKTNRTTAMTAEENLEILRKILDGIRDGDLNEVMSELGFEVSKSTDKSTEWVNKNE